MGEGRFDDLPRMVCLFGRPIATTGSEAVWHGLHALLLEQLGQGHTHLPAERARRRLPHGEAAEPVRPGATDPPARAARADDHGAAAAALEHDVVPRRFRPERLAKPLAGRRVPSRNPTRIGGNRLGRRPPDLVSGARSRRGRESGFVRARLWTSAGTAHVNGGRNAGLAPCQSANHFIYNDLQKMSGGEGGIRTHVPVSRQDAFEAPPLRPLRYLSANGPPPTGTAQELTPATSSRRLPADRRWRKNACMSSRHSASSTPPTMATRWLSAGWSSARITDWTAPERGSGAP